MLAIATSIDALAVGISFAALEQSIFWAASIIGIICFFMTATGMILSNIIARNRTSVTKYANIFGGLLLIAIGVKILFGHNVISL